MKSLFLSSIEDKKTTLNKTLFKKIILKKLHKKFSVETMDIPTRKSLQKKPSFMKETQNMMGETINVFENLKSHHKSMFDSINLQNISKEVLEMKYFSSLQKEISGNNNQLQDNTNPLSKDEKQKKEIENSLSGFKEELQIYKKKIKDQKDIEKKIREHAFKIEIKISQYNLQVKIHSFLLEKIFS